MKKVILFGYLFWAVLVALFIITFPDGINSLGWAIYVGGSIGIFPSDYHHYPHLL